VVAFVSFKAGELHQGQKELDKLTNKIEVFYEERENRHMGPEILKEETVAKYLDYIGRN